MAHVMEQITETMPARAVVLVSQLVGRAGGGSKVKSFAHEHHRSPADRLAGLCGERRRLRRGRGSPNKLMLLMCGPWSKLFTFPFRAFLRLLRKPENDNVWWSRISEQLVEELVKLQTLRLNASALAQIVREPQSRSNTFPLLRVFGELMQSQSLLLSVSTGRNNYRSVPAALS